ncbi:MAG TPA: transcriptional repressor [Dissulfurispiraceae bacterium]|nr:transcriptional repressor [Dissulfurispiraceae bacterium]
MEKKEFDAFISKKGLKCTKERDEIVREILCNQGHFAPDDLFVRMKSRGSKVSRASIYRTIPLLVEGGLIAQVEKTDKHAHYEKVSKKSHHDHMICTVCGKVTEFYSGQLERLQERLCRQQNFRSINHCLEIMGICKDCGR